MYNIKCQTTKQSYSHDVVIYSHDMRIYFHDMRIYFHALKIVLRAYPHFFPPNKRLEWYVIWETLENEKKTPSVSVSRKALRVDGIGLARRKAKDSMLCECVHRWWLFLLEGWFPAVWSVWSSSGSAWNQWILENSLA